MRGKELEQYVHIADWYATLCHIAGATATDERAQKAGLPTPDSINHWPVLSGAQETAVRTNMHISPVTYIEGDYKIIIGNTLPKSWGGGLIKAGSVPFAGYWPGYGAEAKINTLLKRQDCGG